LALQATGPFMVDALRLPGGGIASHAGRLPNRNKKEREYIFLWA